MLFIADTQTSQFHTPDAAIPMAIGKDGATCRSLKREGDGKTPLGRYSIEHGYYRADRMAKPASGAALHVITANDGWCDAPSHARYNDHVSLPFPDSHETLMRGDMLYDLVFVLSHNRWPAAPGYGSAIFLHVAREENGTLAPTQGCLALPKADLITLSKHLNRQSWIIIR